MSSTTYVGNYSGSGSKNYFYTVSHRKCGFKSFPNKSLADFSYSVQSDLAKKNLAPRVYGEVGRIKIPKYYVDKKFKTHKELVLSDWGYLTEVAKPFYCHRPNCDSGCFYSYSCSNQTKINKLMEDILSFGLNYHDAHNDNLGYVTRGKQKVLVVIDLGAESIVDDEGNYPNVCWDGDEESYCECEECEQKRYRYCHE